MWPQLSVWLCVVKMCCASMSFSSNGYKDIVVAIHKDVPQNNTLIAEIQDMFRSGSRFLYEALDHRAYFRNVTILVPSTWTPDPNWTPDDKLTFKNADVRVDSPHPLHQDDPYVFQPGQCGEQGRYIHFTPRYMLNEGGLRNNYGDSGRVLVHEFAHYRYGVFDEQGIRGSRRHPVWYFEGRRVRPTGCSRGCSGSVTTISGYPCQRTPNGLLTDDCVFVPYETANIASSIMSYLFPKDVTKFCKSEADSREEQHNAFAPNQHNKMCERRGTYDVIMDHVDFREGNPPVEDVDVTPTFDVVQVKRVAAKDGEPEKCGTRTILVLDISGSMIRKERYFKLGQAGDRLIRDILPLGTEFGVVIFNHKALVWSNMTIINNETARNRLASNLPKEWYFIGGTCIGCGLNMALQMLQHGVKDVIDNNIILITDGSTRENLINDTLPAFVDAQVKIHSIGMGEDSEETISQLSSRTGGLFSYYSESDMSTDLDSAMERLRDFVSICDTDEGIELERRGILMDASKSPLSGTVTVDNSVGENTLFSFAFSPRKAMTVTLTAPDLKRYDAGSKCYSYVRELNIVRFRFPLAKTGAWQYTISTSETQPSLVMVVAKSSARTNVTEGGNVTKRGVEVETRSNLAQLDFSSSERRYPVIYAYVHRGYQPVIYANVTVTVDRTPDPPVTLTLRDDGNLPDNKENDGVYTVYLTQFNRNQRISMQARVENIPGQTGFILEGTGGSSAAPSLIPRKFLKPKVQLAGNFTRTSSPGAVDVKGVVDGGDLFPPGTISDLEVVTSDPVNRTVTLSWTSPGGDLDQGTVTLYELRIAADFIHLKRNFNTTSLIEDHDIIHGSLTPLPAGTPHNLTLALSDELFNDSFVFGLKAFDDTNRVSDLSNLPSLTFDKVEIPNIMTTTTTSTTTPTTTTTTTTTDALTISAMELDSAVPVSVIVGGIIGAIIGVVLPGALGLVLYRKRSKVTMDEKSREPRPENPMEDNNHEAAFPMKDIV